MIWIAGYVRVSSREQAMYGYSLDEQERKIKEYVDVFYGDQEYEYTLYREEGESAKTLKRPKITEIIQRIESGQLDVLVINNLDRLTRSVVDMQYLIELFQSHNTVLTSIKENIDWNNVQGRFFISMISLIAQWEKETLADRTMRGKYESARQGNYSKGSIPFGYEMDRREGKKLVIREEDAAIVRRIFKSVASGTHTPYTIARELRSGDPEGRKWRACSVLAVIQNTIYYGTFTMNSTVIENHTPPIVDRETWLKANRNATGFDLRKFTYLFKDKVECSSCQKPCFQAPTTKKSGKSYLYYCCPGCRRYMNEEKITDSLEKTLNEIAINHNLDMHIKPLTKKLYTTELEIKHLIRTYASGRVKKEYYDEMLDIYLEEKKDIMSRISEKREAINEIKFSDLPHKEKDELVKKYIVKIHVGPDSLKSKAELTDEYERMAKYER